MWEITEAYFNNIITYVYSVLSYDEKVSEKYREFRYKMFRLGESVLGYDCQY